MKKHKFMIVLLVLLLSISVVGSVLAQTGSGFDLTRNVLAAGGITMSGSGFTLTGTTGQTAAGPTQSGAFTINQGFWYSFARFMAYLPFIIKP